MRFELPWTRIDSHNLPSVRLSSEACDGWKRVHLPRDPKIWIGKKCGLVRMIEHRMREEELSELRFNSKSTPEKDWIWIFVPTIRRHMRIMRPRGFRMQQTDFVKQTVVKSDLTISNKSGREVRSRQHWPENPSESKTWWNKTIVTKLLYRQCTINSGAFVLYLSESTWKQWAAFLFPFRRFEALKVHSNLNRMRTNSIPLLDLDCRIQREQSKLLQIENSKFAIKSTIPLKCVLTKSGQLCANAEWRRSQSACN